MPAVKADIQDKMAEILEGENLLNTMWGQCDYVIYTLSNREIDEKIVGGIVLEDETDIAQDDELLVFKSEGAYRIVKAGQGGAVSWASDDIAAIKFVTQPSGTIGAQQVAIEAKERMIETLQSDYQAETDDQKKE